MSLNMNHVPHGGDKEVGILITKILQGFRVWLPIDPEAMLVNGLRSPVQKIADVALLDSRESGLRKERRSVGNLNIIYEVCSSRNGCHIEQ